ncbi:hypothetical protein ACFL4Q_03025 [candidate division KSB1 bacterium]
MTVKVHKEDIGMSITFMLRGCFLNVAILCTGLFLSSIIFLYLLAENIHIFA